MKPEVVNLNDYQAMVDAYHKESDRAAAVLAGSFVEHYLANYIRHFLVDDKNTDALFDGFGPLSTFDQRISIAHAFRLISDEMRSDLLFIKKVRDRFAHTPRNLSFDDQKIKNFLSNLSLAKTPGFTGPGEHLAEGRLLYLVSIGMFSGFVHNQLLKKPKLIGAYSAGRVEGQSDANLTPI